MLFFRISYTISSRVVAYETHLTGKRLTSGTKPNMPIRPIVEESLHSPQAYIHHNL